MTTNTMVGLLALLLLAAAALFCWDWLKLWWAGLFETREPAATTPPEIGRVPPPPRRAHQGADHAAVPRRPGFHRSGRRSSA